MNIIRSSKSLSGPAMLGLFLSLSLPIHAGSSVIGGRDANPGEVPWHAYLNLSKDDPNGEDVSRCGGTILGPTWVVTANHCVTQSDFKVGGEIKAGLINRKDVNAVKRTVKRILLHPDAAGGLAEDILRADICLLELDAPLEFGPALQPVSYVTRADSAAGLTNPGTMGRLSGFGDRVGEGNGEDYADILQVVDLPIISLAHANRPGAMPGSLHPVTPIQLPAGPDEGGKSGCYGDSGGPLVVPDGRGGWMLAGIVSYGAKCGAPDNYSIFTRVSTWADWIQQNTGIVGGVRPAGIPKRVEKRAGGWQAVEGRSHALGRGFFANGRQTLQVGSFIVIFK